MSTQPIFGSNEEFFTLAQRRNVIFYHKGYFSHNIIAAMAEVVKLQLEITGIAGPTRRKLFSSFVELAQNIMHYSSDSLPPEGVAPSIARGGAVCICVENGHYLMLCLNPMATASVGTLHDKLEPLRSMTLDEIKRAYKTSLREEAPENSKGAGLGFLTMARDASAPLEFDFHPLDDDPDTTLFHLKAII